MWNWYPMVYQGQCNVLEAWRRKHSGPRKNGCYSIVCHYQGPQWVRIHGYTGWNVTNLLVPAKSYPWRACLGTTSGKNSTCMRRRSLLIAQGLRRLPQPHVKIAVRMFSTTAPALVYPPLLQHLRYFVPRFFCPHEFALAVKVLHIYLTGKVCLAFREARLVFGWNPRRFSTVIGANPFPSECFVCKSGEKSGDFLLSIG